MTGSIPLLLLANALLLLAGLGLLPLLGAVRTVRELAARSGLAYLCGLAAGGILSATLALVGVATGWLVLAAFAGVSLAAGSARLALLFAPPRSRWRRRAAPASFAVGAVAAIALAVLIGHAGQAFAVAPLVKWDSWFIWATKGHLLLQLGSAKASVFGNPGAYVSHLEYPLLVPSLEAVDFRALGVFDVQALHVQFLLFAPAGLAALASLLGDRVPALFLWPALLAIGAAPGLLGELLTGYADLPLAVFFAVGAAAAGRWLLTGERWPLALAALFFGAACLTKSEGSLFVAAAYVALAVQLLGRERARLRPLVAAALATLAILLPWRIFLAVHGIHNEDYRFSDSWHVHYLAGRLGRGPIALQALVESLLAPRQWALLVPLFLVAAAAGLLARRARLPLYGLTLGALALAGLVWIYVISPVGLPDYLHATTDRVTASIVLAAAALAPLIAAEVWEARR